MRTLKIVFAFSILAALPQQAVAGAPDFPAYHGQKESPFNWCAWFASAGLTQPYKVFC